jgi:arylsulfatase A-like enzyme
MTFKVLDRGADAGWDWARMKVESESSPRTVVSAAKPALPGVGAGAVVLIGTWIGLIAGFGDVGFLVINRRWIFRDFYHLGADFPWIIPLGVMVMVLVPALLIALFARIRGSVRLGVPVLLLSLIAFLDLSSRLRLELWATFIISVAMAVQLVRLVRSRPDGFLRLVRRTVGWLMAILAGTILVTYGGRVWSEYRQQANLPPPLGAQNVLLIVWDTVRAANTSLHGYRRPTTPNLLRLASGGVRFDRAFASSSWTLPSHASMLTGRWPHELGVNWKTPVRDGVPTLAGYLASHGYSTAGFVANLDYCSRETGLARGFAHYEDFSYSVLDTFNRYIALGRRIDNSAWTSTIDAAVERKTGRWYDLIPRSKEHLKNADAINDAFLKWLGKQPKNGRPFFAFLNYNDAHTPYEVPEKSIPGFGLRPRSSRQRQTLNGFTAIDKTRLSSDDVQLATDVYDDCILYLDRRLGLLLDELSRQGVLDNTLVVVTSDHGEHLGDHGLFFHGGSLYRQLVQVPLLILGKSGIPVGRTVVEPVSLCDLPATLIDLLGLGPDHPFTGRSLARYWQPRSPGVPLLADPLLMETTKPELIINGGREPAARGPMKALVAAGMHYIQMGDGSEELYNINSDVEEKDNLAQGGYQLPVVVELRNLLDLMLRR